MSAAESNTIKNVDVLTANNSIDSQSFDSSNNLKKFDNETVNHLFESSENTEFSHNHLNDKNYNNNLEARLQSTPSFLELRRNNEKCHLQFSEKSQKIIDDANQLLQSIEERHQFKTCKNKNNDSNSYGSIIIPDYTQESTSSYSTQQLNFSRIDFDDIIDEELSDRKPAWKQLQENIKNSYRKPKRLVERSREINETQNFFLSQQRRRVRRSESPFSQLNSKSFVLKAPSLFASSAIQPRDLNLAGSGPYAAPAVSKTQGIESTKHYDHLIDDIEERLLKTTILPKNLKIITKKEFDKAQIINEGVTENLATDDELNLQFPRPFYSRPDRSDPDYFDFDLQHSIDLYRKPEGKYIPRGPQPWENKLLNEAIAKGEAPLSGYMFTKGAPPTKINSKTILPLADWRSTNTSYLSAALRTPSFWEHRFTSIGSQVRDSNPVSMDSIMRNKPVPNKFTEYRDPDFADYDDPKADD